MAQDSKNVNDAGWLGASGLLHIARTLTFAVQPSKLLLALAGIVATLFLGWALDGIWSRSGSGVADDAIVQFTVARQLDRAYEEPSGGSGIFGVWKRHEQGCVVGLLRAVVPGASVEGALQNILSMGYGVWWLVQQHPFFLLLFGVGALFIWSWVGGVICRIAGVEFACDEKPTLQEAFSFVRERFLGGYVLAPCIPIAFIGITAILLLLGGMLLRVPVLGDLIAGLFFCFALLGGFVITLLSVGLAVGGSLFWPAVAVEGSDAFDAFSRSLSYPFTRPWKTIIYGVIAVVYASLCWLLVNLFVFVMLKVTHAMVAFGTAPLGRWSRAPEGEPLVRKLDLLWPMGGPSRMYDWPNWEQLSWYEYFSAFLIGVSVLLVIGLMWSFLASLYFSASTVVYYLLRRDVDGTDLGDVYEAEEETPVAALAPPPAAAGGTTSTSSPDASPPVAEEKSDTAPTVTGDNVTGDHDADGSADAPKHDPDSGGSGDAPKHDPDSGGSADGAKHDPEPTT